MSIGTFSWICPHGVDHRLHGMCQQCDEELRVAMFNLGREFRSRMELAIVRAIARPIPRTAEPVLFEISLVRSLSPGVEPRIDQPPGAAANHARWINAPPIPGFP